MQLQAVPDGNEQTRTEVQRAAGVYGTRSHRPTVEEVEEVFSWGQQFLAQPAQKLEAAKRYDLFFFID